MKKSELVVLFVATLAMLFATIAIISGPGDDDLAQVSSKNAADIQAAKIEVEGQINSINSALSAAVKAVDAKADTLPTYSDVFGVPMDQTQGKYIPVYPDSTDTIGVPQYDMEGKIFKSKVATDTTWVRNSALDMVRDDITDPLETKLSVRIRATNKRVEGIKQSQDDLVKTLNAVNVQIADLNKKQQTLLSEKFVKVDNLTKVTSRIDSLFYISDSLGSEIEDLYDEIASATKTLAKKK